MCADKGCELRKKGSIFERYIESYWDIFLERGGVGWLYSHLPGSVSCAGCGADLRRSQARVEGKGSCGIQRTFGSLDNPGFVDLVHHFFLCYSCICSNWFSSSSYCFYVASFSVPPPPHSQQFKRASFLTRICEWLLPYGCTPAWPSP